MQNFDSLALTLFEPLTITAQIAKICRWYPTIDSTNSEARRCAPKIAAQLAPGDIAVFAAEQQTAGRGRMERAWQTIPGQSLAASFITRLPLELIFGTHGAWLTTLAGIALLEAATDTVNTFSNPSNHCNNGNDDYHFQLKWPNDLICQGKKIAGILTESVNTPEPLVIFGIGFNLTIPPKHLPTKFATSLHLHYALPNTPDSPNNSISMSSIPMGQTDQESYDLPNTLDGTNLTGRAAKAGASYDLPSTPDSAPPNTPNHALPSGKLPSGNVSGNVSGNPDLRDLLASKIATRLSTHLKKYQADPKTHCSQLHAAATKFSYTLGKVVSVTLPDGKTLQGTATRLLPNASLEILTPSGPHEITVGDVNAHP